MRPIEIELAGAKDTLATKQDLVELRADLRAEIHTTASNTAHQMYTAMLGQLAVLLGIAYFFLTHLQH